MFGKKEDYAGPEWISLRDRLKFVDFQIMEKFFRYGGRVKVREEYCNACGHCVKICPCNVTQLVDRKMSQSGLFTDKSEEKQKKIDRVTDRIKQRYGKDMIGRKY